jgi:pyruvate dehydrogenase E2 component (dihydrolipoamide acetyltransferase)
VSANVTFRLPDAGEGLTEAEIVKWHVAPGDQVSVNQVVVEIETAKSVVELPSPYAGVVDSLAVSEGAVVPVGDPILVIRSEDLRADDAAPGPGEDGSPQVLVGYGPGGPGPAGGAETSSGWATPRAAASPAPLAAQTGTTKPPVLAKPPVRALAKQLGVDLATVRPSGPGGIVTREDVLGAQQAHQPETLALYPGDDQPWLTGGTVSADGRSTRVPVRSVRKRTAEAMVTSAFTAPHVTVFQTVDVTKSMKLIAHLKQDREFAGVRITPLLIVAKALMIAVRRHPEINASWDSLAQEIIYKHYVNLGIAAATDRGLIVPNIKDAHRLNLRELASALADLTATAKSGKTTPAALADGTITITNVGVFGIDTGTPILSPGEAAILALGTITLQPWVHKGKIKPRHVTQLALSFDHRLVDGGLGAVVLSDVARVMENPAQALMWS